MTVDRDAGVVTFTRQLPTGVLVERWRIRTASRGDADRALLWVSTRAARSERVRGEARVTVAG